METMKQSSPWSSLSIHGSLLVIWWLCVSCSSEIENVDFLSCIWPWRSRSITSHNEMDLNQVILHLWSKFGGPSLNRWWILVQTSSKWGKFGLWRSRSITAQNNGDLNQGLLHLCSKLGNPHLNGSQVIAQTSKWLTQMSTHTRRRRQLQSQRTKLAWGQNTAK